MRVEVWTDGSGMATGGPIGWAYVLRAIAADGEVVAETERSGGEDEGTNNRAELLAIIHGLEALTRPARVIVVSDSEYAIGGYGKGWVTGWVRRGWRNVTGEPVRNADLWVRLGQALAVHQVSWQHVKGHAHHWVCPCGAQTAKRPAGNNCTACDGGKPVRAPLHPLNDRCDQLAGAERRQRLEAVTA